MTTEIQHFSLREFAEQKGMPTRAGEHVICEPLFEYEMSVPGIYFGSQFVSFSHQIVKNHKGQNYHQIATDILRNASEYKIHQLNGYTTKEGGPVYSICHMMSNDKKILKDQTVVISAKQFSEENGDIVSFRPIKRTESNPKGVMFTRHLANGLKEDVRGIGCVNKNGDVTLVAISKGLEGLYDWEISKEFKYLQVGKVFYCGKDGKEKEFYILLKDREEINDYLPKETIVQNTPYYLFFDTETTGLPKDDNAPASNTKNWPRLVQLAWILTDKEGNTLASSCNIIKPEGFTIPDDAVKVHGINTNKAMREGKPLRSVIEDFLKAAEKARCLVGHNVAFDQKVVGAELCRLGITDTISTVKAVCTMEVAKDYCGIPGGYYGYKPPKLQELYQKLFGTTFDNAHDAMADVKATKKCFFELKRRDVPEMGLLELMALLN